VRLFSFYSLTSDVSLLLISKRAHTPIPSPPRSPSPTTAPGPSQLLTTLLARLPDATNRSLIDQAAVDFAFLNSKAARKRLIKVYPALPSQQIEKRLTNF
jgi:regulator of nonsense transcripts 2